MYVNAFRCFTLCLTRRCFVLAGLERVPATTFVVADLDSVAGLALVKEAGAGPMTASRECWYVAATLDELGDGLLGWRILEMIEDQSGR